MTSLRHNLRAQEAARQRGLRGARRSSKPRGGGADATGASRPGRPAPSDGYLDAARESILDLGWKRTTLTEVARRAGVSRMTIYRTWSDMSELLGDLMTREWATTVKIALDDAADDSELDRLVTGVLRTVRALRGNEFFMRILELDPELILPYLLARRGRSQELVIGLTEEAVRRGQRAGDIRAGDPTVIARALALALHGFVLSAHTMTGDVVTEDRLEDELAHLLRASLRP